MAVHSSLFVQKTMQQAGRIMPYQKGQQTLGTELMNGFCTEQIPYGVILPNKDIFLNKKPKRRRGNLACKAKEEKVFSNKT